MDILGLAILLLGIILLVVELTAPGYYAGVAGAPVTMIGAMQMLWPALLRGVWGPLLATALFVVAFAVTLVVYRRRGFPSQQPLLGSTGTVAEEVRPATATGRVDVEGTLWQAEGHEVLEPGTRVVVESVEATHIMVGRAPESSKGG